MEVGMFGSVEAGASICPPLPPFLSRNCDRPLQSLVHLTAPRTVRASIRDDPSDW